MLAIFRKSFRDSRRTVWWLSIGFGLYLLLIMGFYPTIKSQAAEWQKLIDSYPEGVLTMFYGAEIAEFDMTDPGMYIQTQFGGYSVLILGAIVIVQAFNAFTNAERDHSLDMVLSLPVSRRAYLFGRALNTALGMALVLGAWLLTFLVSMLLWPEFDASVGRLVLSIVSAFLFLMVVAGYSYLLAVAVPSSRRFAGPIAYLLLIGTFLIYGLSAAVDALKPLQPFLINHYFNMGEIIRNGIRWSDWAVMIGATVVLLALAGWWVDRKEFGV